MPYLFTKSLTKSLPQNYQKTTSSETKEKAKQVCEARIFTQSDFRKINAFLLKQQMGCGEKRRNDDVKLEEEVEEIIAR